MTFDCQEFSTHTRKFLLHKRNLYAHFERLESSSLLGQGVGGRGGSGFPVKSVDTPLLYSFTK